MASHRIRALRLEIPPRAWSVLHWLGKAGEIWLFLPPAVIAVSLSDTVFGTLPTAVVLMVVVVVSPPRSSVKAAAGMCGGMYLGMSLLTAANSIGQVRLAADPAFTRTLDAVGLCLFAGGLGAFALTVAIPVSRTLNAALPGTTRVLVLWISSLAKWGFSGAAIGAFLANAVAADGLAAVAHNALAQPLLIAVGGCLGLVVGGLKADAIAVRSLERG